MTLEKLLNILLERGWRPRNREKTLHICCYDKCKGMNYQWVHLDGGFMNEDSKKFRELVSKESGLWQFVCENGMVNINNEFDYEEWGKYYKWNGDENEHTHIFSRHCDSFWLIESALCDEDELEKFLLENIKVE